MEMSVPTKKFYKQFKKVFVEEVKYERDIMKEIDKDAKVIYEDGPPNSNFTKKPSNISKFKIFYNIKYIYL